MRKACVPLILVLSACAAQAPQGDGKPVARVETPSVLVKNTEVTRADDTITNEVRKAIRSEPILKGIDIEVQTREGEVTLSGLVKNPDERQRAEGLARTVPGVKNVNSRIELTK
jgi:hyperosmotically inducible protein